MQGLKLQIHADEWVRVHPQDNRSPFYQHANKAFEGSPGLELLQRARYVLRVQPLRAPLPSTGEALFTHGLLLQYMTSQGDVVDRVCAVNISDKIVKVYDGMCLSPAEGPPLAQEVSGAVDDPEPSAMATSSVPAEVLEPRWPVR